MWRAWGVLGSPVRVAPRELRQLAPRASAAFPLVPVGVAHFAGSTGVSRDVCIRRFAFKLMDVRGAGFVDRVRAGVRVGHYALVAY